VGRLQHGRRATAAPDAVKRLVERFARNQGAYLNPAYNETQLRREFLDPFFKALGWDVDNEAGFAEQYKDVVHEDAIKVGLSTRAPDYSFRVGGQRKFFVEAKKPAVNLKDDPAPAYQVRRYAWSAKLPLSILTDFQELAAYDCRVKPGLSDSAAKARVLYVPYTDYDARWDEIAGVFGKEAVYQGSFDRYAESMKAKKGTAEVDKAFLAEIEAWRDALARNIALRNASLSQREMNYAVQATIDRIIFLRICEDRAIEPYGRLQGLLNGGGTYGRLKELFREADARYNSGLFHFAEEKGRPGAPDRLTPALTIDDKPLKDIIRRLYYPESPYEFSVLPADILGQVYEQFLGKVIRLTPGHRAVVEDKPEVKKAGGVYYTPTYIVDYIVEQTVGRLLEGLTPKQAASLRILDPACGSGSFLIGAYQRLLDWHRDWYVAHGAEKHRKEVYQGRGGAWRLTTAEKKRILVNSIYGVDIDAQAVETTKLSLLLKVLEDETAETIDAQLSFLHQRALPDLAANIKCGNSLIGPDFYADAQLGLAGLNDEERYRINVFDWEAEFPHILGKSVPEERRGFDAVIGNPPYIRINRLVDVYPKEARFIQAAYPSASFGKVDIYVPFVERGFWLLSGRGRLGFIVPNKFIRSEYGRRIREILAKAGAVESILDFGHAQVFPGATTYTCLLFLARKPSPSVLVASNESGRHPSDFLESLRIEEVPRSTLTAQPWLLRGRLHALLMGKLERGSSVLGDIAETAITGVKTGRNSVFSFECLEDRGRTLLLQAEGSHEVVELESVYVIPYCKAESLKRYACAPRNRRLLYPYQLVGDATVLVPEDVLRRTAPLSWHHLNRYRAALERRERGKRAVSAWYGLSFASDMRMFRGPKIATATLATSNAFSVDYSGCAFPQGAGGGCGIMPKRIEELYALLAIMNSRLLTYQFQSISSRFQGGWFAYEPRYLRRMSIRLPSSRTDEGRGFLAILDEAARELTRLHAALSEATTSLDCERLKRESAAMEKRVDRIVYDLYGLTDDEIALVEESTPAP